MFYKKLIISILYFFLFFFPFSLNVKAQNVDYEKLPYSKNKSELTDRWRKQLKLQALSSFTDKQTLEEDKKAKDVAYQVKSFDEIEKESSFREITAVLHLPNL